MTRDDAIKLLNCTYSELADKLELSTAAVARWANRELPYDREYEILELAAGRIPKRLLKAEKNLSQANN
ncbi:MULTISPECIES: ribonuclease D [Acinetobacter]|uniref:ribonuclease D n=1 Tax=Acinetobacter TaxID=469 RepID=UPI000A35EDF9|nr:MULTISPECIES: ribonuclease D [Acinetobacter]MBH8249345.1 ribonuclease D [Acinetobacter baumannii]MCQ1097468.1 ribonuclease D [Acinetobacter baumannii]MCZ2945633.1 ribonuclease D [Acinetobacter baumannii]MDA3477575.1 ribonuclease D [Acinetobacter baumannii]MDA3487188.1 ribonuclease D [Acinetobacter baumannii]